jgi:thioredoxin-like negative regulator of GroEL
VPAAPIDVVCLCAAWCRLCDDDAPVLRSVVASLAPSHPGLRLRWLDIEDEAELLGDVDVETFPTLVVVDAAGRARFAGPVMPQADTLQRLLQSLLGEPAPASPGAGVTPEVEDFVVRLRAAP